MKRIFTKLACPHETNATALASARPGIFREVVV
jgi:hypothetical protein